MSEWTDSNGVKQQTTKTIVVSYTYDDNQKLIQERTEVAYSNVTDPIVSFKKYNYNTYGDVVRTESYVDGEENKTGKNIQETFYDKQGRAVKTVTYNTLDSSTKYYAESEYDEEGKVVLFLHQNIVEKFFTKSTDKKFERY